MKLFSNRWNRPESHTLGYHFQALACTRRSCSWLIYAWKVQRDNGASFPLNWQTGWLCTGPRYPEMTQPSVEVAFPRIKDDYQPRFFRDKMNLALAGCALWGTTLMVSQESTIFCPWVTLDQQTRAVVPGNSNQMIHQWKFHRQECRLAFLPIDGTVHHLSRIINLMSASNQKISR